MGKGCLIKGKKLSEIFFGEQFYLKQFRKKKKTFGKAKSKLMYGEDFMKSTTQN